MPKIDFQFSYCSFVLINLKYYIYFSLMIVLFYRLFGTVTVCVL